MTINPILLTMGLSMIFFLLAALKRAEVKWILRFIALGLFFLVATVFIMVFFIPPAQ